MTYWSSTRLISAGLGTAEVWLKASSLSFSSAIMSLHRSMHSSQIYTVGPAISLRTSSWLLPQNEHTRLPARSSCLAITASHYSLGGPPAYDYLIDQSVFNRLLGGQEQVAVGILFNSAQILSGVAPDDIVDQFTHAQDLARLNLQVGGLSLRPAKRLVHHDARMGQRVTPALGARQQQDRGHAGRLPQTEGRDRRLDELHRIVDCESGGNRTARRVDIKIDLLFGIFGLEEQ